jgi:hypothetical protein
MHTISDNRAAFKFFILCGEFGEDCLSPENCAAILVEFRSRRKE